MADVAVDWYAHISAATEALKVEVFTMNRNKLTPLEFGYKICGHPDALIPTARAKMRNARVDVSYAEVDVSGHLVECPRLYDNTTILNTNREMVEEFIKRISSNGYDDGDDGVYFRGISSEEIASLVPPHSFI